MAWNGLNVARQMTLPLIVPVESRIAIVAGKDHVLFLDMGRGRGSKLGGKVSVPVERKVVVV